jgi:hypothetical protein
VKIDLILGKNVVRVFMIFLIFKYYKNICLLPCKIFFFGICLITRGNDKIRGKQEISALNQFLTKSIL